MGFQTSNLIIWDIGSIRSISVDGGSVRAKKSGNYSRLLATRFCNNILFYFATANNCFKINLIQKYLYHILH